MAMECCNQNKTNH